MLKKLKQKVLAIFKKNPRSKNEVTIGEVYYED